MSADLEREAREAAEQALDKKRSLLEWTDNAYLYGDGYRDGYLAAATLREEEIEGQRHFFNLATEEIATMRARVAELETELAAARDNFDTAREEILHLDANDGLDNDAVNVVLGILDDTFSTPIPAPETKP